MRPALPQPGPTGRTRQVQRSICSGRRTRARSQPSRSLQHLKVRSTSKRCTHARHNGRGRADSGRRTTAIAAWAGLVRSAIEGDADHPADHQRLLGSAPRPAPPTARPARPRWSVATAESVTMPPGSAIVPASNWLGGAKEHPIIAEPHQHRGLGNWPGAPGQPGSSSTMAQQVVCPSPIGARAISELSESRQFHEGDLPRRSRSRRVQCLRLRREVPRLGAAARDRGCSARGLRARRLCRQARHLVDRPFPGRRWPGGVRFRGA